LLLSDEILLRSKVALFHNTENSELRWVQLKN
jgi:hypothetical protein